MAGRTLQLVRHVEWNDTDREPTLDGLRQSRETAARVSEIIGEGNPAVVLSSDRERAVYTAAGIAARLGALVYPSVRIREGGEFPAGIRDLDAFVAKALAETDAGPLADGTSLIVVTHQPLIDMVNIGRTGYGEVVPYTPAAEGWNNPNFTEGHERLLERLIEQAQVNG